MTSDSPIKRPKMFLCSPQTVSVSDSRKGDVEHALITFFPKNVKRRTAGRKEGRKGKNEYMKSVKKFYLKHGTLWSKNSIKHAEFVFRFFSIHFFYRGGFSTTSRPLDVGLVLILLECCSMCFPAPPALLLPAGFSSRLRRRVGKTHRRPKKSAHWST